MPRKAAAASLALLCLLTAPGRPAYAAAASVASRGQTARPAGPAALPSALRIGPFVGGAAHLRTSPPAPGRGLSPDLRLRPAPELSAAPALPEPALPTDAAPAPRPAPGLRLLQDGAAAITAAGRSDSSPEAGRQALDRLFAGLARPAPTDETVAAPERAEPGPVRTAGLEAAGPRGPPSPDPVPPAAPRQSLARSALVGWVAAIVPFCLTVAAIATAAAFGYEIHPNYSPPAQPALNAPAVAGALVMGAVMAPVSEEVIFRAGLMGGIGKLTRRVPRLGDFWLPALSSSLVFVLLHETAEPLLIATRLVHSLIMSRAYHKEGLASSIFAHGFFNGLALTLPLLGMAPAAAALLALSALACVVLGRQRGDRRAGRLVPYELGAGASLSLAGLLLAGVYVLPNLVWFLGMIGWLWYGWKSLPPDSART